MTDPGDDPPLDVLRDAFLDSKGKGRTNDTGAYRRNLRRDVTAFLEWLKTQPDPPATIRDVTAHHLRRYARHLDGRDLAAGTVRTYYGNVSAFLGWCTREGYLDENPAQAATATEPLPDDAGHRSGDQQAWRPADRRALTQYLDERVYEVLDDPGASLTDRVRVTRDRAFAYVLAYAGIRGAELLAAHEDHRRNGATWNDLDLEDATLTVFSKKQAWDDRSLPGQTHHPLAALQTVLAPPSGGWPLFPTLHRPTLYRVAREGLARATVPEADREALLDDGDVLAVLREYDIPPPALTTDGGRRIMRRLTDAAGIELSDDHGYLAPHGGRRGAGEAMVRAKGFAAAARLLDDTERMVRERYSHIEAGELAKEATDAFDQVDASARRDDDH